MKIGGTTRTSFRERTQPHSPPEELASAMEEFNTGNYHECYHSLEFISLHEPRMERNLYQGIIQIALALASWQEGDFRGAIRLLRNGIQFLQHVTPVCQMVDVDGLVEQTGHFRERLEELGMERMNEMDPQLIPRIQMT